MTEKTLEDSESIFKSLFKKKSTRDRSILSDLFSVVFYFSVGIGFIYFTGKTAFQEFGSRYFSLEVKILDNKIHTGDKVNIDPMNKTFELDSDNSLIYKDKQDLLPNSKIKLTLFPQSGNQEVLATFYLKEAYEKILIISHKSQ